ncbi:MAG: hypothetical protein DRR42_07420 [Gammaproteobacteria bacterium]|nr:MAG: hypothetical protein DRR42_07420 [Gammaproteobacteria bacterium]
MPEFSVTLLPYLYINTAYTRHHQGSLSQQIFCGYLFAATLLRDGDCPGTIAPFIFDDKTKQ